MNATLHDTHRLREQMNELIDHLHADGDRATEPQARAMFQTTAEVLAGLVRAFAEYELKSEAPWSAGLRYCRDAEL